jgi:hypothetical protein
MTMDANSEKRPRQDEHETAGGAEAGDPRPPRGDGPRKRSRVSAGDTALIVIGVWMMMMGTCVGACSRSCDRAFSHGMVSP